MRTQQGSSTCSTASPSIHARPSRTPSSFRSVYGIVVNGRAERFFDEGRDSFEATFEVLGYEIWRNQQQTAFFIGDQTTLGLERIDEVIVTDVPAVTAETIGELAVRLGLDPGALEQTVAEYNAAVGPEEFDPYVFDGKSTSGLSPPKSNWAFPLDSPPFVAYPLTCAITFTFGGIRTDSSARVVGPRVRRSRASTRPARSRGSTTTSTRSGTSVLRSLTFGRLAGANAARETDRSAEGCRPGRAPEELAVQFRRVGRRERRPGRIVRWRVSRPCGAPSTWRSSARR